MRLFRYVTVVAVLWGGCSGDDEPMVASDGGPPLADSAAPPTADPPVLTPCPPEWREVIDEPGIPVCDPWPVTGHDDSCPPGQAHFPGEPGCRTVGSPCPPGDYSDAVPTDRLVLYVQGDSPSGGDGSRAAPYATIGEALGRAFPDTTVAVAKGTFDERIRIPQGVTVRGACAAETTLTTADTTEDGVVLMRLWQATLSDVTVADGATGGLWISGPDVGLRVEGVVVSGSNSVGILVEDGGFVEAEDVVIRDTAVRTTDLRFGHGVHVQTGGRVHLSRAVVERNHVANVFANIEATVLLEDVALLDGIPGTLGGGRGLNLREVADATVRRSVVEGHLDTAVFAGNEGTILRVEDTVVRDTRSSTDVLSAGRGINVQTGAALELDRVLLERNEDHALFLAVDTEARFTDLVARDNESNRVDGRGGRGVTIQQSVVGEGRRVASLRNQELGVAVADASGRIEDLIVRDTREAACSADTCAEHAFGTGVGIYRGSTVMVESFLVSGSALCGIQLSDSELDLAMGRVTDNAIGACVQVDGYDYDRLTTGVSYEGNATPLDATTLPVPEIAPVL